LTAASARRRPFRLRKSSAGAAVLALLAFPGPAASYGPQDPETSPFAVKPVPRDPDGPPDWAYDAVLYSVDLASFPGSGKIVDLEEDLPRIRRLGANCVVLAPVQPEDDPSAVRIERGTADNLRDMILQAHSLGQKVVLDWDRPADVDVLAGWTRDFGLDGFRFIRGGPADPLKTTRAVLIRTKPEILLAGDAGGESGPAPWLDLYGSASFGEALLEVRSGKAGAERLEEMVLSADPADRAASLPIRSLPPGGSNIFGEEPSAHLALLLTGGGVPMIRSGEEAGEGRAVEKMMRRLAAARKKHPAFSRGQTFRVAASDGRSVLAFARFYREDAIFTAVNLSKEPFEGTVLLPEIFRPGGGKIRLKRVLPGPDLSPGEEGRASLRLPPWGAQVWVLR